MKLSIVVPVYNVERYVRKCLLSIIHQEDELFNNIEVIIVNDGTKDKSVEQIKDLADKYDNIALINQDNQGLSVARNQGMKRATGEYVWFVDSDDWISSDAVKVLMPFLDGRNDIITFAFMQVTEDGESLQSVCFDEPKTFSGKDTFRNRCEFYTMAQKAIYRKRFMENNKLSFMPGIYSQDDELCIRASYLAEKVTILPQPLYYFLRTTGEKHKSIMNTVSPKYGFDYITVVKSLATFKCENVKEKDLSKIFDQHISILINNGLNSISRCSENDQLKFVKLYRESKGLNKHLFNAGGKYFLEGLLFSLCPSKMLQIYYMMKKFEK